MQKEGQREGSCTALTLSLGPASIAEPTTTEWPAGPGMQEPPGRLCRASRATENSDSPIHALLTLVLPRPRQLCSPGGGRTSYPTAAALAWEHQCLPGVAFPCRTSSVARAMNTIPSSSSLSVSELSLSSSSELTITRTGAAARWRELVWRVGHPVGEGLHPQEDLGLAQRWVLSCHRAGSGKAQRAAPIPPHQVPLPGPANLTCHRPYLPPARGRFCASSHWVPRWSERCSSVKEEGPAGTCPVQTPNPSPGGPASQPNPGDADSHPG